MKKVILLFFTLAVLNIPVFSDSLIVKSGIVFRNAGEALNYNAWPSVAKLDDGRIAVVFSGYRAAHICPFGKTAFCTAPQDTLAFSSPRVINDSFLDDRDAGILAFGDNRALVTWFAHSAASYENDYYSSILNSISNPDVKQLAKEYISSYKILSPSKRDGGSYYKLSRDGGKTWGMTKRLPISSPHGPTALSDGSLLYMGKGLYTDGVDNGKIGVYKSFDSGESWARVGEVSYPDGVVSDNFHEAHAIELSDGTLLGAIRGQSLDKAKYSYGDLTTFLTHSADGGRTWSVPEYTGWDGAPPHLLLHSSGAVICTVGKRTSPQGIRAYVSSDNGKSWSEAINISDFKTTSWDLGYPASTELDNGNILTVFYQHYNDEGFASILYTVWRIN